MAKILVVEDEPAIAESLAYALTREGFGVTLAGTLAQAGKGLADADLILLDLMLPDGSGFELIGMARRSEHSPPIIVLSSRDGEADRVAALETGADDYVTKPFSPREIVARVRAVLRRTTTSKPSLEDPNHRFTLPLHLEQNTRRFEVRGQSVELTRVEFDLVSCMLEAPGRVFTRAQLIDRVWGDGFAITDRTIDSHIKGLRKKIVEADGDAAWVETVRGVGYRVAERSKAEADR